MGGPHLLLCVLLFLEHALLAGTGGGTLTLERLLLGSALGLLVRIGAEDRAVLKKECRPVVSPWRSEGGCVWWI